LTDRERELSCISPIEGVQKLRESRRAETPREERPLAQTIGDLPRKLDSSVAVHVRQDNEKLGALDHCTELVRAAPVDVARVTLETMTCEPRHLAELRFIPSNSTDDTDTHDSS
jgi:hypothetical protein